MDVEAANLGLREEGLALLGKTRGREGRREGGREGGKEEDWSTSWSLG